MSVELVTVASYTFSHEAEIDRAMLEHHGIPAFVADAHIVATNWFLSNAVGGVKLQVRAQDLERAQSVLKEAAKECPNAGGWGNCDQCGGEDLEPVFRVGPFHLAWVFSGMPIFLRRAKLRCRGCGAVSQRR